MAKPLSHDPHESEREREAALVQSNSFITTAATMLLGVLAGTAESRSESASDHGARHTGAQPDDNNTVALPTEAHDTQPETSPLPDAAQSQSVVDSDSPVNQIETAVVDRPAYVAPAHADDSVAATGGSAPVLHHAAVISDAPVDPAPTPLAETPHILSGIAPQLSQLGSTLSQTVDDAVSSVLHSTAPLADTTAALLNTVLSIPDGAVGSLVSATFGSAGPPSAVGEIIDTASLTHFDLPMPALPLLGQAHTDGQDHHDGAFSAIGVHF
jgi:hypothetical protein